MHYHVAACYPGTDDEVEDDIRTYGFRSFMVTLPLVSVRKNAFPGYLFVDTRLNPFVHPVDGITEFLMIDDYYAAVDLEHLRRIQAYVDAIVAMPSMSEVFDFHFSGNRKADFFDTPGEIVFEKSVNIRRFAKGMV